MQKYLGYDAETGGLFARQHSLLTLYMASAVLEFGKFRVLRDLDLKIKPNDDECYNVTAGALAVNKIDLIKHDKEAITIDAAAEKVYYFLKEESEDGRNKLIRMGQNEPFDKDFLINHLLKEKILRLFTDYHTRDTAVVAGFLKDKGLLPVHASISLKNLAKALGISVPDSDWHTAKGDVNTMFKVYEKFLTL